MARTALYPGSFDPLTNGHVEILTAAFRFCDRLIVGVGVHPSKTPMLPAADRLELIAEVAEPLAADAGVQVKARTFDNLVIDFAREVGATILIRGLRDGMDLEYEMQLAGMNRAMAPNLQTVFLPATPETRHITATLVRQIAALGGDVGPFVPHQVAERLKRQHSR